MNTNQESNLQYVSERFKDIIVANTGINLSEHQRDDVQKKNLEMLSAYLSFEPVKANDLSIETVKLWLLSIQKRNQFVIPQINALLDVKKYGWEGDKYISSNKCAMCRKRVYSVHAPMESQSIHDVVTAKKIFEVINEIFFNKECGWLTLLGITYNIAALFLSKLASGTTPLKLQFVCDRDSGVHELVREIVSVCDINTGIREMCKNDGKWACDEQRIIYPATVDRAMERLVACGDIPTLVEGFSGRSYRALLKEIANNSNRQTSVLNNTLPTFIGSKGGDGLNGFLEIDVTGIDVKREYLDFFTANKPYIASVISYLVENFTECLFPHKDLEDAEVKYVKGKFSFSEHIKAYIGGVSCTENARHRKNIGVLKFFFNGFMRAFDMKFNRKFPEDSEFEYKGVTKKRTRMFHMAEMLEKAEKSLGEAHGRGSLDSHDVTEVAIESLDKLDFKESERLLKKARKYEETLTTAYKNFKVPLLVKGIRVKGERFIFDVTVPAGIHREKIFKLAEEVRVVMGVEFLKIDKGDLCNTVVISEKRLKENSLSAILDSREFNSGKYKIPFAVGYDIFGEKVILDLSEIIHAFIAGTTGSGKSTALYALILSILRQSIGNVNLLIFDFGVTYLNQFGNVPHLSHPIIRDMEVGQKVILQLKEELDRRRILFHEDRNEFNKLPVIFTIIDEAHNFLMYGGKELVNILKELLNVGRGLRMNLILVFQDPTTKNAPIGATNVGTVLAFRCARDSNSRVMIGESGCEKLTMKGDAFLKTDKGLQNVQGAYISETGVAKRLSNMTYTGDGKRRFVIDTSLTLSESSGTPKSKQSKEDNFDSDLAKAIMLLLEQGKISNTEVQKMAEVGFDKANVYMDKLVELGLIPPPDNKRRPRKLIIKSAAEISTEVIALLEKQGYSYSDIEIIFAEKG